MQTTKKIGLLLAALTMTVATVAATPAGAAEGASRSTSDVVWFADPGTPVGTSQLARTNRGVAATFRTSGLMPREALTLWWVVFNQPSGCTDPCGEDDIFLNGDPAQGLNEAGITSADIVAAYATGTVATKGGNAFMAASLRQGGAVREVLFGAGSTLKDAQSAEIHLVARSHGPAVPGLVAQQLGSYAGGCDVFLLPPSIPTDVGQCADIQFAIHHS